MDSDKDDNVLPLAYSSSTDEKPENDSVITGRGAFAAVSYMASAVLLIMFNKAALSSYSFPYANVITLLQTICSCLLLYAMKYWKIISFTSDGSSIMNNNPGSLVPVKTLLHTLPLAASYLLYMLVTMESVRAINVPMYTTLRRTTIAFTMVVEYLLNGKKHSLPVVGSVGIIILGAFVAGARDLSFDAYGYAVVVIANICTAVYLTSITRIGKSTGLNSFGLMWCNGIICAPILLVWTLIRGDLNATLNFRYLSFPGFQKSLHGLKKAHQEWFTRLKTVLLVVMLLSCIMAFCINYFVFLNTTLNSALTQTICGNMKDLFTIGIGWALFGGLPYDLLNVVGQSLGFFGSCLYAFCKINGK